MTDKDENRRIVEAKSRISRFSFENSHLIKQIEGLKKEINTVEANKERLIAQLEDSNKTSAKENEPDAQDGSESESLVSSNPVSTISLSDFSDTGSSISSVASLYCVDPELLRRQRSLETTLSSDLRSGAFDKNKSCFATSPRPVPDILDFEAITWLKKFIQNLNDIKSCFSPDRCENYQLLDTKFAALQELAYNRMESLINNNGESDPSTASAASESSMNSPDVLQAGKTQTQPLQSGNTSIRQVLSLNYFLNFLSIPFIFLLGYIGLLMYANQADSCFITPPQ